MKKKNATNDLIEESVKFASQIKESAQKTALNTFSALITEDVKEQLTESEEPFPTSPDQPGGYDAEGAQKRIDGAGDKVEDKGNGPDIIEGDEPAEADATMGKEDDTITADNALDSIAEMDDLNLDLPDEEGLGDDEKDMNMESTELSVENDDEDDKKDKKDVKEGDKEDEEAKEKMQELVKERKVLRTHNARLKVENSNLKKGFNYLKRKLEETALINAKMDYVHKINNQFPTLSVSAKKKVFENIDKTKTLSGAKAMFETIVPILKENTKRKSSSDTSRAKQIVETAQRNADGSKKNLLTESYSRMSTLAGID